MLQSLELYNFRNFQQQSFEFSPCVNLITGANGSGKSSILEALFYLARGRSFRISNPGFLLKNGEKNFTIRAHMAGDISLASNRDSSGKTQHKVNGEVCATMIELSSNLPILFLDTNSQRWLAAGPKNRRQMIDWGLFYGRYHEFFSTWRNFRRALLQRNAAIKALSDFHYWDEIFTNHANQLNLLRSQYVHDIQTSFDQIWHSFPESEQIGPIEFKYFKGHQQELLQELASSTHRDQKLGHTAVGPHRADLLINVNNQAAHSILSQGQQKLLTYALTVAQAHLHKTDTNNNCILLLDDVCAELDLGKRASIFQLLKASPNQTIITGVVASELLETFAADQHITLADTLLTQ